MGFGLCLQMGMRLEQRQELRLELKQCLPEEFEGFFELEEDDDWKLLEESLPFLVMHEASHPLYEEGKIYIPKVEPAKRLAERITERGYRQGEETGIDRAGMIIGSLVCRHTPERMIESHTAMMGRVYRDVFQRGSFPFEEGFIARLQAELRVHKEKGLERTLYERIEELERGMAEGVKGRLKREAEKGAYAVYEELVAAYGRVYRGTKVIAPGGN